MSNTWTKYPGEILVWNTREKRPATAEEVKELIENKDMFLNYMPLLFNASPTCIDRAR